MNIKELNITELKALAFDHVQNIERSKMSLQLITEELNQKTKEVKEAVNETADSN